MSRSRGEKSGKVDRDVISFVILKSASRHPTHYWQIFKRLFAVCLEDGFFTASIFLT